MNLLSKSDSEVLKIAEPLYIDNIKACNTRNWDLLSKHMSEELITSERRRDVEESWDNTPHLTSLSDKKELLGILRRKGSVHILWKQWSTIDDIEYLGVLILVTQGSKVRVNGFFIK
jgi:hypothetical protein